MSEKELEKIEQRFKFYPMAFSRVEHEDAHRLIAEVRRLQEELQKTHESAFVYSWENKRLKEQCDELAKENEIMKRTLTKISKQQLVGEQETAMEAYLHESYYILVALAQKALDQAKGAVEGE